MIAVREESELHLEFVLVASKRFQDLFDVVKKPESTVRLVGFWVNIHLPVATDQPF